MPSKNIEIPDYRVAFVDIETTPLTGMIWGMYEQNVLKVLKHSHLLSFSVKWQHEDKVQTYGLPDFPLYQKDKENDRELALKLWNVFNDADLIIGHNSNDFDNKKSAARFIYHKFAPPSPYKTVDTLKVARKYFSFPSNKLGDLAEFLGLGAKEHTGGFDLWVECGDPENYNPASWKKMLSYNKKDVVLLEQLYNLFRGWDTTHPNVNLSNAHDRQCPVCSKTDTIELRGFRYMKSYKVQKFVCLKAKGGCGKWSSGSKRVKINAEVLA